MAINHVLMTVLWLLKLTFKPDWSWSPDPLETTFPDLPYILPFLKIYKNKSMIIISVATSLWTNYFQTIENKYRHIGKNSYTFYTR